MKKILLALALLALLIAPSYAITFSGVRMGNPDTTTLTGVKAVDMANIGGLTFMKDYTIVDDNTLLDATEQNFTQTNGSPVATYNPSRSASIASTKFTTSGDMTIVTTSNVRRQTEGYMNESGFSLARGELIEGSAANLLTYTYCNTDSNSDGKCENVSQSGLSTITGTPVYTSIITTPSQTISDLIGINGAGYQRVTYTGVAGDSAGSKELRIALGISAAGTIVNGNKVTHSIYVKKNTLTNANIKLKAITTDVAVGLLTNYNSSAFTISGSEWVRISFTFTVTDATANRAYFYIYFDGISDTSVIDVQFSLWQPEVQGFPTSYIPTTTAAVTRAAENLTYPTAGNINSLENISIVMRYRPVVLLSESPSISIGGMYINPTNKMYVGATNASNNYLVAYLVFAGSDFSITSSSQMAWNRYEDHTIILTCSTLANALGKKTNLYVDGILVASGESYTPINNLFTSFSVGSGIREDFYIYQKALTQAEVTKIQTILTTEN